MCLRRSVLLTLTLAVFCAGACARQVKIEEEQSHVRQALDTYLESVDKADVTLASAVWVHSPEIVAVTPAGRFEGWDNVQRDLYVNFLQKAFLERHLKPSNLHIHVNGTSAWAVFDWSFTAKLANGQPFTSKGRETHVYEKTDGVWRIVHLHYSGEATQS
jgi:ketosteroid isomerase-like protein